MKPPLITCACCDGTGKHALQPDHWRTLKRLRSQNMLTSILNLQEEGVTRNAINNRLVFLESQGLIRRVGKSGKFILWEARPPAKKAKVK